MHADRLAPQFSGNHCSHCLPVRKRERFLEAGCLGGKESETRISDAVLEKRQNPQKHNVSTWSPPEAIYIFVSQSRCTAKRKKANMVYFKFSNQASLHTLTDVLRTLLEQPTCCRTTVKLPTTGTEETPGSLGTMQKSTPYSLL